MESPNEEEEELILLNHILAKRIIPCLTYADFSKWRQTMTFRTHGRCKGKLCNLIIDWDSTINFVVQEVIDNIQLPIEKLPKPYEVSWFMIWSILVSHRRFISFKIVTCEDNIWCDVIHTNVTHILLGWPWHFDIDIHTNKVTNPHSF